MSIKIGELARLTDTAVETIRYYEKAGLLPAPSRSDNNYRVYGNEHIERLQFVRHCRTLDMTLNDVRTLLQYRDTPSDDCGHINDLLDEHIQAVEVRMSELEKLKQHLINLRRQCGRAAPTSACGILRALSDHSCHDSPRPCPSAEKPKEHLTSEQP